MSPSPQYSGPLEAVVPTLPQGGYDPALLTTLARYEDGNFWFEPRRQLIVGLLDRYFPQATRYLELGCGTGHVLAAVAAVRPWSEIVGADLHAEALELAAQRVHTRVTLRQSDARHIPEREHFDLIGAFDVLEHIIDETGVINEIGAALAPEGGLIVTVPQHPWLWSEADSKAQHVRRYRRGELENKLIDAGFVIRFSSSYTVTLLPIMAISRLVRRRGGGASAGAEFKIVRGVPYLNDLLRFVLAAETSLTLRGVRWPAGGSRVIVAQKKPALGDLDPKLQAFPASFS